MANSPETDGNFYDPMLAAFRELERIEKLAQVANPLVADIYIDAISSLTDKVNRGAQDSMFMDLVADEDGLATALDQLDVLEEAGFITPDKLTDRRQEIYDLGRIASRFLGLVASSTAAEEDTNKPTPSFGNAAPEELDDETREFWFGRSADEVAEDLRGMKLRVGNRPIVTITGLQPQDANFNEKFLDDPIFGDRRAGAEVVPTRGNYILYIAAGLDGRECIRVTAVKTADDVEYGGATKVTSFLGLDDSSVIADVKLAGNNTVRLVNVRPLKK